VKMASRPPSLAARWRSAGRRTARRRACPRRARQAFGDLVERGQPPRHMRCGARVAEDELKPAPIWRMGSGRRTPPPLAETGATRDQQSRGDERERVATGGHAPKRPPRDAAAAPPRTHAGRRLEHGRARGSGRRPSCPDARGGPRRTGLDRRHYNRSEISTPRASWAAASG